MLDVTIARATLPSSGALLLPVEEGAAAKAAAWAGLDTATDGAVGRALEAAEFKGKKGQTVTDMANGPMVNAHLPTEHPDTIALLEKLGAPPPEVPVAGAPKENKRAAASTSAADATIAK